MGSQLAAGRLLYGMGRGNAPPRTIALAGAGILEFFAGRLGEGA